MRSFGIRNRYYIESHQSHGTSGGRLTSLISIISCHPLPRFSLNVCVPPLVACHTVSRCHHSYPFLLLALVYVKLELHRSSIVYRWVSIRFRASPVSRFDSYFVVWRLLHWSILSEARCWCIFRFRLMLHTMVRTHLSSRYVGRLRLAASISLR